MENAPDVSGPWVSDILITKHATAFRDGSSFDICTTVMPGGSNTNQIGPCLGETGCNSTQIKIQQSAACLSPRVTIFQQCGGLPAPSSPLESSHYRVQHHCQTKLPSWGTKGLTVIYIRWSESCITLSRLDVTVKTQSWEGMVALVSLYRTQKCWWGITWKILKQNNILRVHIY